MAKLQIYAKPQYLYRYRPLGDFATRETDAIKNNYFFCPTFQDLNDPMEGIHRLSKRLIDNDKSESRITRIKNAIHSTGIASFSEVNDHEPMWAHYADQFRGMCIQYNLNRLINGLPDNISITRMLYSENAPVLLSDTTTASVDDRARLCLSSKTVRWASEREWRAFAPRSGRAYCDIPKTVTKIYLRPRVNKEDESKILSLGRKLNIQVLKMELNGYSISFKQYK